jgi:hypothetical protein
MMRSRCAAEVGPNSSHRGRTQRVVRVIVLAAMVAVHDGCAAGRPGPRDVAALETNAQRTCAGVPLGEIAPGLSGLDVVRVDVLERPARYGRVAIDGIGAIVRTSGRSFDSMSLLMRCRAARAVVSPDPDDPLAVTGASVRIYRDDGEAVVVQIRSWREDVAREIVTRTRTQLTRREDESATNEGSSSVQERLDPELRPPPPARPTGVVPPSAGPARPSWRP